MPESGSESPKARHFRRLDPKEYREAKRSERKHKAELPREKIERKQALAALSQDNPEVADRTDLENLAALNIQPEAEVTPERKLLNIEMTGTQAVLLLGGTMPETINRAKIEEIVKGKQIQTEKINKGSHSERDEYWNGEKSPYKDKTFNERMEIWTEKTNNFLNKYKGKPAEAFLKRMDVDLTNENAAQGIYDFYFVKGKGDVGLFASTIVENNTTEQIEENMEVIQKLGNIYGENSAKLTEQLVAGIKNAQTDTDLFVQSAQENLQKGENMPGMELINNLDQQSSHWEEKLREAKEKKLQAETIENEQEQSAARQESDGNTEPTISSLDANIAGQPEISPPRQKEMNVDDVQHEGFDKWNASGSMQIDGDHLSYLPKSKKEKNPYVPGSVSYDNFEKHGSPFSAGPNEFSDYMKKRVERGIRLAVIPDAEFIDPEITKMSELKKVPSPALWAILEANPNSQDKKYKLTASVDSLETVRTDVSVYDPDEQQVKVREGDLGYSWKGISVDKETLVNIQHKALVYLEAQVNAGEMPQAVLDTARGILRYTNNAPEDSHIEKLGTDQKASGGSPEDPRVEMRWWKFFARDKWSGKGQLGQNENYLFYQDEKLKRQNRQRQVIIADSDPDALDGKLVLTKAAWDILRRVPLPEPGYSDSIGISNERGFATLSSEKPVQDKKGIIWKSEVKPLTTDSLTLSQMQRLIRNYVDKQVSDGQMEADVLATVDGILKYKHGTLEPLRYEGDILIYRIKGKEKPPAKRLPVLIDKIVNEASSEEPSMSVDVTPEEIRRYLTSKKLPAGASIRNLNFEINGTQAKMTGFIDVPIPFMGGKIHFNLELANNPDGSGLVVTKHHVETKSGTLRSKLGDLETNLSNINSFISDDINEQLRYHDPFLRVLGLSITQEGQFSLKVQNSKQAAA